MYQFYFQPWLLVCPVIFRIRSIIKIQTILFFLETITLHIGSCVVHGEGSPLKTTMKHTIYNRQNCLNVFNYFYKHKLHA